MKKASRVIAIVLVISILLPGIVQASDLEKEIGISRLSGNDRVETSIEVSKKAYSGKVDSLILAGYNGDADALTAAFMAGGINAPLLISDKNKIGSKLLNEIKRLDPKEIILLGEKTQYQKILKRI